MIRKIKMMVEKKKYLNSPEYKKKQEKMKEWAREKEAEVEDLRLMIKSIEDDEYEYEYDDYEEDDFDWDEDGPKLEPMINDIDDMENYKKVMSMLDSGEITSGQLDATDLLKIYIMSQNELDIKREEVEAEKKMAEEIEKLEKENEELEKEVKELEELLNKKSD